MARKRNSHTNPSAPVATNAGLQLPVTCTIARTSAGAIAPPTDDPLSNNATAQPVSRRGNHSATAFVAAGQFADSAAPSKKRNEAKLRSPVANDVSAAIVE